MRKRIAFAVFALFLSALTARAQNLLVNGSMQAFTGTLATGWTMDSSIPTTGYSTAQDTGRLGGSDLAQKITITAPASWGLFLYQVPSPALTIGQSYTWTFWYKISGTGTNSIQASVCSGDDTSVVFTDQLNGTNGAWTQHTVTFTYNNAAANMVRWSSNAAVSFDVEGADLEITQPPAAPTAAFAVSASASISFGSTVTAQHGVSLTWTDTVNPAGTTYKVYRAAGACSSSSSFGAALASASTPNFSDAGVVSGASYCYQVTAVSTANLESKPSNQVSATIP